jgi:hypothetical protein
VLAAACLLLAAAVVSAAPLGAAATRAEAARWLEDLREAGAELGMPLAWRYSFVAAATERLEALSLELVTAGFAIEGLKGSGAGVRLSVTRVELLAAAALVSRNRELESLARRHGVRYVGVEAVSRQAR